MIEQDTLTHHIQRHIVKYLLTHHYARFRDMRPPRIDTNLYSYHLKLLQAGKLITKTPEGYTLSAKGLAYVDRVNAEHMKVRTQPKIITMLLVQDGYGKVLVQRRTKQPYINTWTLPYGKIHIDDQSVVAAAGREAHEKLAFTPDRPIRHVGDCYIRVVTDGQVLSTTLAHICRFETDDIAETDDIKWIEPLDLARLNLAPAVEHIVARAFFGDEFFFEEFEVTA